MPWSGPRWPGEFPSLGQLVTAWQEAHCVIPDRIVAGDPFILSDEQAMHQLWQYRLWPEARFDPNRPAAPFVYYGSLLVRSQKWGKAPFSAARLAAQAEGPVLFAGWAQGGESWDCADHGCRCGWEYVYEPGEPMGMAWATPHLQVAATSDDQPLALETRVPTPTGWSTVGELRIGDEVFAQDGQPTRVVRQTPVLLGEECYAVTFSDGERIVASASHKWTIERKRHHGGGHETATLSTRQLAQEKRACRVTSGGFELPDVPLEVDPYLLGLWLGDGATADATIALDTRHRAELERIIAPLLRPYETAVWGQYHGNQGTVRIRKRDKLCAWGHDWSKDQVPNGAGAPTCGRCRRERGHPRQGVRLLTFRERLRGIGVLGRKHIPATYLRAGTTQRRALLQGLIDSDGHIASNGRACFTNTNERLARDVGALLTSLGYPWWIKHDGFAWRVQFTPGDGLPVARLAYKAAAQKPWSTRSRRGRYRYVVSVEPVPSVPVRCIGVATSDHLFLVGERAVPTHNTDNIWRALKPMIERGPLASVIVDTGLDRMNLRGGGIIEKVSNNATTRLGARIVYVEIDQPESMTATNGGEKLADTLLRNVAGMGGRWAATGNAHDPSQESVQQTWIDKPTGTVHIDYPEPLEGSWTNRRDRRRILKHAYQGSPWVDIDRIEADCDRLAAKGDPGQAERWFGNRVVAGAAKAFDRQRFEALAKDCGIPAGRLVTLGGDGAKRFDATGIVATDVETGHQVAVAVWERPLELPDTAPWGVPIGEVNDAMEFCFTFWRVWRANWDPPHYVDDLARWAGLYGDDKVVEWWTNRVKQMAYSLREYHEAMGSEETPAILTHGPLDDSPEARDAHAAFIRHVGNAVRRTTKMRDEHGWLWTISKDAQKSVRKIDLAMAGCLSWTARQDAIRAGALNEGPEYARAAWQ